MPGGVSASRYPFVLTSGAVLAAAGEAATMNSRTGEDDSVTTIRGVVAQALLPEFLSPILLGVTDDARRKHGIDGVISLAAGWFHRPKEVLQLLLVGLKESIKLCSVTALCGGDQFLLGVAHILSWLCVG